MKQLFFELDTYLLVLDILIASVVFFSLYIFMRGTKAVNMLLGVLLLFGLAFIARLLNLKVVDWIFGRFVENIFIVLLILFHPEIRRVLLKFGRNEWIRFFLGENKEIYDILVRVVTEFCREKTGALFVLQRFSGMQSVQETGVNLYAHASIELLKTIYYAEGPLHDGAVLIKNNMIVAAGCLLPLSESSEMPHSLGTRHRAAVGASEDFDCVVIVVSAETGKSSIAFDGNLRHVEPGQLKAEIVELMKTQPIRPSATPKPPQSQEPADSVPKKAVKARKKKAASGSSE